MALIMAMMSFQSVCVHAIPVRIILEATYEDPFENQGPPQKSPVEIPEVGIEDNTLYFTTPCYGCTLRLLDENGNVAYTTVITGDTLVLPSTLNGTFELQIIHGFWCFYGDITF